jgi:hypothetical protein
VWLVWWAGYGGHKPRSLSFRRVGFQEDRLRSLAESMNIKRKSSWVSDTEIYGKMIYRVAQKERMFFKYYYPFKINNFFLTPISKTCLRFTTRFKIMRSFYYPFKNMRSFYYPFQKYKFAVVKALRYIPEGREIDSRWCQNFSLT